jgi:histidinol-phosphate aminotransferase
MLPFIRSDLLSLTTYTADPEGSELETGLVVDRLDTNEFPTDLPETLKQHLATLYLEKIASNRYPNGDHLTLKTQIAAYGNEAIASPQKIDHHWITIGNGSDELIRSVLMATCVGGEGAILVAQPTFSMYAILAQTLGIQVVSVARDANFVVDLKAAQAAVTVGRPELGSQSANPPHPPIRVVFVVHPNSPTGNCLTALEIEWLRLLPPDILVVVDEAYFEFSGATLAAEVFTRPNWLILRTCSKAFRLAAHRVGYGIAQPPLIQILEKMRLPYNLPALSIAAAESAIAHRQDLLAAIPSLLQEREALAQALAQTSLEVWPSQANFLYVQAESTAVTKELYQALKAQGTSIRLTGGGIRITIGTPAENSRTLERLQKLLIEGGAKNKVL